MPFLTPVTEATPPISGGCGSTNIQDVIRFPHIRRCVFDPFVATVDESRLFRMGFPSDDSTVAKTCTVGRVETPKKCGSVTFKVLGKTNDST